MTAGYSKRPLVQKLGIKPGFKIIIVNPPANYDTTLGPLPDNVTIADSLEAAPFDFIHFFTTEKTALTDQFQTLMTALRHDGMLWISWPKGASKVPTDLNGNLVRGIGLTHGLVDVKVVAVDEVWSGLKFVYRLEDR